MISFVKTIIVRFGCSYNHFHNILAGRIAISKMSGKEEKKKTQQQQNHPQQHENEHKTEHGQENRTTETLSPSTIEPSSKLLNQETTR